MEPKEKEKELYIAIDRGLPVLIGVCRKCNSGMRSLVTIGYEADKKDMRESAVLIQCIACEDKRSIKFKELG